MTVVRCVLLLSLAVVPAARVLADLPDDPNGILRPIDLPGNPTAAAASGWRGTGQGGLLVSSGNTEATAINFKLDLKRADGDDRWQQGLFLTGLYGRSQGLVSNERLEFRYQLERLIDRRNYWFTGVDAVRDLFSGFDYRVTTSAGLGRRFVDTPTDRLSVNLGVGYEVYAEQTLLRDGNGNLIGRANGPRVGGVAGTLGLKAEHTLSASTKLLDVLAATTAGGDATLANDLALNVSRPVGWRSASATVSARTPNRPRAPVVSTRTPRSTSSIRCADRYGARRANRSARRACTAGRGR